MSERPALILERFPLHLAATDPGKRFGTVVTALAADLDVLTRQLRDVRTAHRIGEVPTVRDLLGLAALHGIGDSALGLLARRLAALRTAAAADPPDTAALTRLLAVPESVLAALGEDGPEDLAAAVSEPDRHLGRLELQRGIVLGAVHAHSAGNATPTSLLLATAAYVGFELKVEDVRHTGEGWWHLATCLERIRLTDLVPVPDVLALEENPFRRADLQATPKRHAQRTRILRGGMEDVDVTIRVIGIGGRTVRPMIVHLGTGRGVVYEGTVPDGIELAFGSSGQVTLDGSDVTGSAWGFAGAVFADASQELPDDDFAFTDRDGTLPAGSGSPARFAVATPLDAFALAPRFPHGAAAVGPLPLPRGESRWASLVRVARAGGLAGQPAAPHPMAGRFDESVFAAGPSDPVQPCLQLGFVWEEREPFAVRILLPQRLSAVDDDAGTLLRQPLSRLLTRHRAAGVDLRVEYADPRWTLGRGVIRTGTDDALGVVLAGTELWPDGSPQPDPG